MNDKDEIVNEICDIFLKHKIDVMDQYEAFSIGALGCLNIMYENLELNDDKFKRQFMENELTWSLDDYLKNIGCISSAKVDREGENEEV